MALQTWYSTGTVSVDNGSTTVTGTGTLWAGDAIMPGDLFCDPAQPSIPPQRVMEVTADGELELWAPWPGTSMVDDTYEIRYVGIIERSTAQTRKVLEELGGGNIAELQSLALLANKLLFADESSSLALAEFTAKGQSILAKEDNAGVLAEIGAQPAGDYQPVGDYQPLDSDLTAIAALTTQSFGRSLLTAADAEAARLALEADYAQGSGWYRFPNGLLIQWGTTVITLNANGNGLITLPVSYASASSYQFFPVNGEGGVVAGTAFGDLNEARGAGSFYVTVRPSPGAAVVRVNYFTIGIS